MKGSTFYRNLYAFLSIIMTAQLAYSIAKAKIFYIMMQEALLIWFILFTILFCTRWKDKE